MNDEREDTAMEENEAYRPTFEQAFTAAYKALKELDDWTNTNETEWTGWGDQIVPPAATFWRVKSGQALKAIEELRPFAAHAMPTPDLERDDGVH